MKVLFALNNDNVSKEIIKEYQKRYKEILSYKNVYYFNAIYKELQKDKTYDRVVISEDLEPFANNDYNTIDKFIFEKLDKISDEATNLNGEDIAIILICSDRRNRRDDMLNKFFGIGVYNALMGNDRQIEKVCELISRPRAKKEAKIYYKIESSDINYQSESENSVSETEVQNILTHYKRLGKDEDKYVDSFNTIVAQYTDAQLKLIIRFLPIHVKAVLEERSPKYQELVTFDRSGSRQVSSNYEAQRLKKKSSIDIKMLDAESGKSKITKPIVIPTTINSGQIKRIETTPKAQAEDDEDFEEGNVMISEDNELPDENNEPESTKRGRGRPKKQVDVLDNQEESISKPKRGRGRPRKVVETQEQEDEKADLPEIEKIEIPEIKVETPIDLFNMGEDEEETSNDVGQSQINNIEQIEDDEVIDLFNIDEEKEDEPQETAKEEAVQEVGEEQKVAQQIDEETKQGTETKRVSALNIINHNMENQNNLSEGLTSTQTTTINDTTNTLITKDRKIVSFVGTTKNGTSFIVNNVAAMLSKMNIRTAILDMTESKNAYYIYTNNDEELRNIATQSIINLEQGEVKGVEINKNLTVFTSLPGENLQYQNMDEIILTLTKNYSVVLIDCDFKTPIEVFKKSQEIYLVQTQDVLTIQPLTAFLRNLKSKNALPQEKIKIVINKEQNIRDLPDSVLIGGIAYYNDPSMSFMTELFDKNNVIYCKIPFEMQNYAKYLSSLVNCSITLNGYTKRFLNALQELVSMVYPLVNKPMNSSLNSKNRENSSTFSKEVNGILNKMKKNQ